LLYGKDASFVIRNYMNSPDRPVEIQKMMDEYFTLINKGEGKTEKAKEIRVELDKLDDKLMAKADVMLKFMED